MLDNESFCRSVKTHTHTHTILKMTICRLKCCMFYFYQQGDKYECSCGLFYCLVFTYIICLNTFRVAEFVGV